MSQTGETVRIKSANLPVLCREKIGICTITLTLSSKRGSGPGKALPLCLRYAINGKRFYFPLGESYTTAQFAAICQARKGLRRHTTLTLNDTYVAKKEELTALFHTYVSQLREWSQLNVLSIDLIASALTGRSGNGLCFLSEWERILASKRVGTAESYRYALRSFTELTGFTPKDGFLVSASVLRKWVKAMQAKNYSKATIGIYLRACRVVVKDCIRNGYIKQKDYPFGDRDSSLIPIPKGRSRKERFLSVAQMTELYRFFIEGRERELPLRYAYQSELVRQSLGLFLFQYLANGMNLSDVARLRYDDWYFRYRGEALRFERQKTRDRTDNNSEVIVPVTAPLREIIRAIAAPEEKGGLLFPFILEDAGDESACRRRICLMNSHITARMKIIAKQLGWTVVPSSTWCRHSFATNLSLLGVPSRYISESMGHSVSRDVTSGYIADYPLERQLSFNARLLDLGQKDSDVAGAVLAGLTEGQRQELLRLLLSREA